MVICVCKRPTSGVTSFINSTKQIYMRHAFLLSVLVLASLFVFAKKTPHAAAATKNIYNFSIKSIDGGTIDFSQYKGKIIMIVNTASKCGFTPQYEGLEKLYQQYKDKLVIVG